MYKRRLDVDKLMGKKGFAQFYVSNVITKEEIEPILLSNKRSVTYSPKWSELTSTIQKKYNKWWADKLVLGAQLNWYQQKNDVPQIIKYRVKQLDDYGFDMVGIEWALVNNFVWEYVFKYCNNKDTLNKATKWMELILHDHPDDYVSIDTYANVLYKYGRTIEAIKWETRAMEMDVEAAKKENRDIDTVYEETLKKMKNGVPTWPTKQG